jgi:hypothetical protein
MKILDLRAGYVVNPGFQYRVLLAANVLGLALAGGLFALSRFFAGRVLAEAASLHLAADHPFIVFLQRRDASLLTLCLVGGVFILCIFNVLGLFASHRIAGPLHRLRKHLDAAGEGATSADVRFRDGDYFPELAKACNRLMARVRGLEESSRPEREALRPVPGSRSAR